MRLFRKWPRVSTPRQYVYFRVASWLFTIVWVCVLIHLYLVWQTATWYYKTILAVVLVVSSPSLEELFQSYDSYKDEQQRLFGATRDSD